MKIKKFEDYVKNESYISEEDDKKEDKKNLSEKEILKMIEKEVKKVLPDGWDYEIELIPNKKDKK